MQVVIKETKLREVEVIVENHTLCDKCNKKIKREDYETFECNFTLKTGNSYPEGGSGDIQEMDLCQVCAEEFVDLLRKSGYKVNDSEWDY